MILTVDHILSDTHTRHTYWYPYSITYLLIPILDHILSDTNTRSHTYWYQYSITYLLIPILDHILSDTNTRSHTFWYSYSVTYLLICWSLNPLLDYHFVLFWHVAFEQLKCNFLEFQWNFFSSSTMIKIDRNKSYSHCITQPVVFHPSLSVSVSVISLRSPRSPITTVVCKG